MKIYPRTLDALTEPWLIMPAKLTEIIRIYDQHLKRNEIDTGVIAKFPKEEEPQGYQIENGVAMLQLQGIIAKRMNLFINFSGGTSTQLFERDFLSALNDPAVKSILLLVDSPGGSVDGVQELANLIFESRGKKSIVAYTDGVMASAAYWIGSATDKIYISGDTTQVGSIGVVAAHVDISKAEEKMGIKTTEIVAGKFKRVTSRHEPLTLEGRAVLQEAVDHIYSVFVNDVARNRGKTEKQTLAMADGKVFLGKQAIDVGLVDEVSVLSSLIDRFGRLTSVQTIKSLVRERLN